MKRQRVITPKASRKTATQPTIEIPNDERKKSIYLGDYYCMKELQPKPVTEELLELIAHKLVEFAGDEENISIGTFKSWLKIKDSDYARWMERSDKLKEAHSWALMVLGNRREEQACKRQLDSGMVKHTLYQYSPSFKEAAEFHAKLGRRENESISGGTTFVVVPRIDSGEEGKVYFEVEK